MKGDLVGDINAVLFDKDGTLFDFHETWRPIVIQAATVAAEGDAALAARLMRAGGYDVLSRRFMADSVIAAGDAGVLAKLWEETGACLPRDNLHRQLDRLFTEQSPRTAVPVTDLRSLLSRLVGCGLSLGIATNDSLASATAVLERFGLADLVLFVAGYDSGHGSKPEPGMALAFCAVAGLPPKRVAIVGDSEHDMATGRAAGLGACIGVLSGAGTVASLTGRADLVLKDITELPGLWDTNGTDGPFG